MQPPRLGLLLVGMVAALLRADAAAPHHVFEKEARLQARASCTWVVGRDFLDDSQRTTVTSGWGCSRRSQFCCSRTCRAGCAGGPTVLLEHPASLERQLGARQPAPPKLLDSARQCHGAARQPQPAHHGMRSVPRAARPLGSISSRRGESELCLVCRVMHTGLISIGIS